MLLKYWKQSYLRLKREPIVVVFTLQGTNISPKNGILKMIFLFPRWDMLIPWRVVFKLGHGLYTLIASLNGNSIYSNEDQQWAQHSHVSLMTVTQLYFSMVRFLVHKCVCIVDIITRWNNVTNQNYFLIWVRSTYWWSISILMFEGWTMSKELMDYNYNQYIIFSVANSYMYRMTKRIDRR